MKSKNPCPFCGGYEWLTSYRAMTMFVPAVRPTVVDADLRSRSVRKFFRHASYWADECVNCGAVAS